MVMFLSVPAQVVDWLPDGPRMGLKSMPILVPMGLILAVLEAHLGPLESLLAS